MAQDFRNFSFGEQPWAPSGPDAAQYLSRAADGVAFNLPRTELTIQPVGLSAMFTVRGNFEITVSYVIEHIEPPNHGNVCGLALRMNTNSWKNDSGMIARFYHARKGPVIATDRSFAMGSAGAEHSLKMFEASSATGRLRLVRADKTLRYLVADGEGAEFKELRTEEFVGNDVAWLRLAALTDGATNPLRFKITGLSVEAERIIASDEVKDIARWLRVWSLASAAAVAAMSVGYSARRGRQYRSVRTAAVIPEVS